MTGADMAQWEREFYPVFNREGLVIDVRHNNGGNIDSWILEKLLRKAYFYWQPRVGNPYWKMRYAFRMQHSKARTPSSTRPSNTCRRKSGKIQSWCPRLPHILLTRL